MADLFLLMSGLGGGLAVFGPDMRLARHDDRFAFLLGIPAALMTPDSCYPDVVGLVAASAGDHAPAAGIGWRLRVAGRMVELTSVCLGGGGVALAVSDVTALARAEDEVGRGAALLDATVRHLPHGVIVLDVDDRVAMANPAYNRLLDGAPVAVGERSSDIMRRRAAAGEFGPGDPGVIAAERIARETVGFRRSRRRRPNGTVLDVSVAPLPDGGRLHVVTDVTAQVDAEEELRRTAAAMQAMLANIRHGIILWDAGSGIEAANPVAEALLGTRAGFLRPGRSLIELIRDADMRGNLGVGEAARTRAVALAAQDRTRSHRDRRFTRSGQVLDVRSDPVAGGGFVTTYTDVTGEHRAEQELRDAKTAAEAASDAKSRFLAAVSHELRTPLSQILGFAETLRAVVSQPGPSTAGVVGQVEAIRTAGRHLLTLIDDILDATRLEGGRFDLQPDRVALPRLVQSCLRQVAGAAAAGEIALVADLPPDLPALHADERRLRQALLHLLGNAIKFTEAPGSVRVSAESPGPGGGLRLQVSDSGIGMAAEDLGRIGQPFTQLDAGLSRRYGGAGLGLYVTHAIMSAHGGALEVSSAVGAGTTATLVFPPARVLGQPPAANPSAPHRSEESS